MPTKKRKPDVCTRYAVRMGDKYIGPQVLGALDQAFLYRTRADARLRCAGDDVIVPVRCRALSAATKRSKKRTR